MNKRANDEIASADGEIKRKRTSSWKGRQKNDNTFHRVQCPSGEISTGDRYYVGLPHRHLPFTKFLTFSTVLSHLSLVDLFHSTSAHRILTGLQSFPHSPSRNTSRCPVLSCRYADPGFTRRRRILTPDQRTGKRPTVYHASFDRVSTQPLLTRPRLRWRRIADT